MNNPLARKLIQMNQETLALKMAHEHGIGLMLYKKEIPVPLTTEGWKTYVITTRIQESATAYPMLEAYGSAYVIPRGVEVSNGGRTFRHYFSVSDIEDVVSVISTSPIRSCEGEWV